MHKQKLVLVGNGMAGVRCIEEILQHNPDAFEITIFGSEPHVNYNRILLSTVLQGSTSVADIVINDRDWYEQNNIQLFSGETVAAIDTEKKVIKTDQDRQVPYDILILATGSVPFMLPLPGADKDGVIAFRTIEDCQTMVETAKQYKKAVVIGGGLLGLEAARGLLNLGMDVHVVHIADYLMERQLDRTAAKMLQAELEAQGMKFLLEKHTAEIAGEDRVERLVFKDGTEVEADLVVMAVGVRPNVRLAQESGIEVNRAIVVNDYLETSVPNVYAVGECVEHRGMVYGLVKPLYEQGKILAKRICGIDSEGYEGSVLSTQLKISGVDVFSVGQFIEDETAKAVTIHNAADGIYKKAVFREDKMIGAVLFGDTKDGTKLLDIIVKQRDVSDTDKVSLLQSSSDGGNEVAQMAHSSIICNCNGVSKGSIIEAVQTKGLTTVEEIKACTKASGSCGGCKPLVADLLAYIQSDDFEEVIEKKPMCPCTALTEDEVVQEMQLRGLASVKEVMKELHWKDSEGCSVCRPALQYYLGMIDPEYEIKREVLYMNKQMNAIVQSDGTYSIVPQMYGGLTTADQLRKIADVAERYQIANVAITSEQRILLMGVKQEDLTSVWAELDMPLSATYGNMVQNVKTCIGEHVCQCEKDKALELAVLLEKQAEFVTTPYRIKMGVSACMHNGAGSTTKDIGIMGIDRGWEIYVGGSSGRNVRSGQLLCVAETNEEAVGIISGFIQYYRETANYLERTWQWLDRVGIIHVREVLFDRELRRQLLERLEADAAYYQKTSSKSYS
ncbi:nitrite reductase large subunit NirB [Ectobacillus funiculus]|uniref:nitrite reductase large subunit NirB n=1 Tax=Ectobacillus funiculus TaxID=137993 RepID=UPI00101DBFE0|nr:nitrite reductase large subunit NirB [Ectobacillus funiculus]